MIFLAQVVGKINSSLSSVLLLWLVLFFKFLNFSENFSKILQIVKNVFHEKIKVVNQSKHRLAVLPIGEFTPVVQFNDD